MLNKEFDMSDLGELHNYTGVEFERDKTKCTITMSQTSTLKGWSSTSI